MTTSDALAEELAPRAALDSYLGPRLPGRGPLRIERMTSGMSNELFLVSRRDEKWVLRRPPRVSSAPGAHDVTREHRVLVALEESGVPHPAPLLSCPDADVIGAPFFVMENVDGVSLATRIPERLRGEGTAIGQALIDALAALHGLDWQKAGLSDLGKPDGFTARLVDRWMGQLARYRNRPLPDLDEAAAELRRTVPQMQRPALIHGDVGLHNALFAPAPPARLAALVDWETATIGDPLLDLGHFLGTWITDPAESARWFGARVAADLAGFPAAPVLAERYAAVTGLSVADLDWYRALAHLRIAVILEGAYARYIAGGGDSPAHASLADRVPNVAARSLAICRGEA